MFGLGKMVGAVVDSTVGAAEKAVTDPIGFAVDAVTQPVIDTVDLLDGLTEGEIREKAALRLGADAVVGMTLSEIVDALND